MGSFLHCVIDPMNHPGVPLGVPDRFSGFSFPFELRSAISIDVQAQTQVQVILYPGDAFGYRQKGATEFTFVGFSAALDTIAETGRVMSVALRAINVTANLEKSGSIWAARFPFAMGAVHAEYQQTSVVGEVNDEFVNVQPDTSAPKINVVKDTSVRKVRVTGAKMADRYRFVSVPDFDPKTLAQIVDTQILSAINGAYVVGNRVGADSWDFQPVEAVVLTSSRENEPIRQLFGSNAVSFLDPTWTAPVMVLSAGTKDQQFIVEARVCVELTPPTGTFSVVRALAHRSPQFNEQALNQAVKLQEQLPVAVPAADSMWDKVAGVAASAGRMLGRVGWGVGRAYFGGLGGVVQGMADLALSSNSVPAIGWKA